MRGQRDVIPGRALRRGARGREPTVLGPLPSARFTRLAGGDTLGREDKEVSFPAERSAGARGEGNPFSSTVLGPLPSARFARLAGGDTLGCEDKEMSFPAERSAGARGEGNPFFAASAFGDNHVEDHPMSLV